MKRHRVTLNFDVIISHDESLLPDDDWRKTFYGDIKTHADLAGFLAYNMGIHDNRLDQIDGFCGVDNNLAFVEDVDLFDTEVEELEE